MRVTSMVAGLAIVLAACGGEKKAEDQIDDGDPRPAGGRRRCGAAAAVAPLTT